jgi:hypothetical protein
MKRKSLLLLVSVAAALMLTLIPGKVSANAGGYTTSAYNVDVKVNTDHSYDVTETIDVNFTEPRHGIYRYIPYQGDFYRQIDGEKAKNPTSRRSLTSRSPAAMSTSAGKTAASSCRSATKTPPSPAITST